MCYSKGSEKWASENAFQKMIERRKYSENKQKRYARIKEYNKTPAGRATRARYRAKIRHIENEQQNARNKKPEKRAKLRAYAKEYFQRPNAKLAENARKRIKDVLGGNIKTDRTMKLLDCTAKALMAHLQQHFAPGMNWNNYGRHGWSVDHILPLSMFDLSKPDHQRLAFNFRNCRPAWEFDNASKKNKLDLALVEKHELSEVLKLIQTL